jgi:hypothetical protein
MGTLIIATTLPGTMMLGMREASSRTSQPSACQTRVRSQIISGIPGYLIELAHKGGDTGIKTRHNKNAPKSPTGGRCINMLATRISNSPDVGWISILSGSAGTYGFACVGAIARQKCIERAGNCQTNNRNRRGS